jgi:hypothetical protein
MHHVLRVYAPEVTASQRNPVVTSNQGEVIASRIWGSAPREFADLNVPDHDDSIL